MVPVDDSVEDQDHTERSDDVEDDVGPQAVDIDIPKIHSRTNLESFLIQIMEIPHWRSSYDITVIGAVTLF